MRLNAPLLIVSCLLTLSSLGASLSAVEPAPAPVGVDAKGGTLIMQLSGEFPLRPSSSLFEDDAESLYEVTTNLRQALKDPEPRLVLDLTEGFQPPLVAAEEIAAVLRTKPPGKHVVAILDSATNTTMVVAAACDEVVMVQSGILFVAGLSVSSDYYADALAKIGVKFHAVISGPAKSAPEVLTRNAPSDVAIKEHEQLYNTLDRVLIQESTRNTLDADGIRAARARAPQTDAIAISSKLVDRAVEPGAWLRQQPAPIRYFKRKADIPDLNSLGGMLAFWKTLLDGEQEAKFPQMVAVVELEGMIVDGQISNPGYTIAGTDTADLFDRLAGDSRVVAVVVRVNSGGGSAGASDRIHFAVRRCAAVKPVVALFDTVAASGGYYLGCAAREILVHHGTITGSIGVFALVPDLEGTRTLLGINRHTISTAPRADIFSTGPFSEEKEAGLKQVIAATDARFQGIVSQQRKLSAPVVEQLAGGKVYTGDEAITLGLADRIGDLYSAVIRARELAGITNPLPIERLPHHSGLAARLGLANSSIGSESTSLLSLALPRTMRLWLSLMVRHQPLIMTWMPDLIVQ